MPGNKRWLRKVKYDRWWNPTSEQHTQVPADYKITHTHPGYKQKIWREFQRLMRDPSSSANNYAEFFEDPDRSTLMYNTRDQYVNALNTLRNLEQYKTSGRNPETVAKSMDAAEDTALLNPIASDIPEILQHYLPTSKRAAAAASGIATGFTRAKEKRLRNKFAGNEPASRSAAVAALRGLGEGIINARPGGERLSNAYSHFFNAELLRSQGASEADVKKQVDLGMSLLANDPQFINDIGKYINRDVRATDYIKGTWGKNEVGKYFTEPVTEEQKNIAKTHGITPRTSLWNMAKGFGNKVLARISGGKNQKQMKKDATKDMQADIAHLMFNPEMAQPDDFRQTFTRMTPVAMRAGQSMSNYLRSINPDLANRFSKEINRGLDKSYDALGMALAADQGMDPYNPNYDTSLPTSENAQKISRIPKELNQYVADPNFNPPVGLNYNTELTQGNNFKRPIYNPQRTGGFWTRTPEDQRGAYNPTPQPINRAYPNEYIKNIRKRIGGEKDGDNK
jgi:hypothetical protein